MPSKSGYPRMALMEAVEKVRKVQERHAKASVPRGTAVGAMGYQTVRSGAANNALSSALTYGLLEKTGPGHVAVSALGLIAVRGSGDERMNALREAAKAPPLHQELDRIYVGDAPPSEEAVITQLQQMDFTPQTAKVAARSYIGARRYASGKSVTEEHGIDPSEEASLEPEGSLPMHAPTDTVPMVTLLPEGGEIRWDLPRTVSKAGWERIEAMLAYFKGFIPEPAEESDGKLDGQGVGGPLTP